MPTNRSLEFVEELRDLVEPYHALYLSGAGVPAYDAVGLRGGWMRYFGARSCALGRASVELIVATFYGFHRRLVERAVPDVWQLSTPEKLVQARTDAVDRAFRVERAHLLKHGALDELLPVLTAAARDCDPVGRALFAAHAALDWPDENHLALWWAATLLREHRGDGHVAVLLSEGVGSIESLIVHCAYAGIDEPGMKAIRGWEDAEWEEARERLLLEGWLTEAGSLSADGLRRRQAIEDRTNRLALQPWSDVGDDALERAVVLLRELRVATEPPAAGSS